MPKYGANPQVGLEPRACAACGKEFQPYRDYQIACSRPCRERTKHLNPRLSERTYPCPRCGVEFTTMWSGLSSRQPSCPDCTAAIARASQERKNASRRSGGHLFNRQRERNKKYNLRRYKLTVEQLDAMMAAQDGKCAICGDEAPPNGERSMARLHIDHDHGTGRNRALLCHHCNRGLGYFRDDPVRLRAAADYVERHRIEDT